MSRQSNMFFMKTLAIVAQLRKMSDAIQARNKDCRATPLGGEDGRTRLVLASPVVTQVVHREYNVKDCRIRFAFATEELFYPANMVNPALNYAVLEVYDVNGQLLRPPTTAEELSEEMSNAVLVELLMFILRGKGVDIPEL